MFVVVVVGCVLHVITIMINILQRALQNWISPGRVAAASRTVTKDIDPVIWDPLSVAVSRLVGQLLLYIYFLY